jgi:hypothetical protein
VNTLTKINITSEFNSTKEHLKEEDLAQREEEEEKEKHPENLKICIALFMAKELDIHPKCVPKLRKSIEEAQEENRAQSQ